MGESTEHGGAGEASSTNPQRPAPTRREAVLRPSKALVAVVVVAVAAIVAVAVFAPDPGTLTPTTTVMPLPGTPEQVATIGGDCAKAVAPLRDLAATAPSALALEGTDSLKLTDALSSARAGCSDEEYAAVTEGELGEWLAGS